MTPTIASVSLPVRTTKLSNILDLHLMNDCLLQEFILIRLDKILKNCRKYYNNILSQERVEDNNTKNGNDGTTSNIHSCNTNHHHHHQSAVVSKNDRWIRCVVELLVSIGTVLVSCGQSPTSRLVQLSMQPSRTTYSHQGWFPATRNLTKDGGHCDRLNRWWFHLLPYIVLKFVFPTLYTIVRIYWLPSRQQLLQQFVVSPPPPPVVTQDKLLSPPPNQQRKQQLLFYTALQRQCRVGTILVQWMERIRSILEFYAYWQCWAGYEATTDFAMICTGWDWSSPLVDTTSDPSSSNSSSIPPNDHRCKDDDTMKKNKNNSNNMNNDTNFTAATITPPHSAQQRWMWEQSMLLIQIWLTGLTMAPSIWKSIVQDYWWWVSSWMTVVTQRQRKRCFKRTTATTTPTTTTSTLCPICGTIPKTTTVRAMPCGHTYCYVCLYQQCRKYSSNQKTKKNYPCRTCGQPILTAGPISN